MRMTISSPSPLTIDDLKTMPIAEVFSLVKDIDNACKQAIKDVNVYSENMKLIHSFLKDNMSV